MKAACIWHTPDMIKGRVHGDIQVIDTRYGDIFPCSSMIDESIVHIDLGSNCVINCDKEFAARLVKSIASIPDITLTIMLSEKK